MKTLTKETSKKIQELGIEVETERVWLKSVVNENVNWDLRERNIKSLKMLVKMSRGYRDFISAPNFGETLLALEAIGKKLWWEDVCAGCREIDIKCSCEVGCFPEISSVEHHAHRLTDAFLTGGMSAVDSYLKEVGLREPILRVYFVCTDHFLLLLVYSYIT